MKRKFFSALLLMTLSVASVGMFVSCKDYDDDINGVRDDVTNLRSELETAKADLETQLTQAKGDFAAQIQTATENKADKSYVDDLNAQRIAAETKLQEQIDAVNSALEGLGAGDIQEAIATLAAVTGRLDGVEDKVAAVEKNLEIQQQAQRQRHRDFSGVMRQETSLCPLPARPLPMIKRGCAVSRPTISLACSSKNMEKYRLISTYNRL